MSNDYTERVVVVCGVLLLVLSWIMVDSGSAFAQGSVQASIDELTLEQNERRLRINRDGMSILLGWAAVNMGVGTAGYFMADNPRWKAFHQMNAGWNIVNAAIGTFGLASALGDNPSGYGLVETYRQSQQIRTILAVNLGLDVAYMVGGGFLWERGIRKESDRRVGFGQSLILQGGFLFAFDAVLLYLQHRAIENFSVQVKPLVGELTGAMVSVSW